MDRPPSGLAINGLLRTAFVEENSVINEHVFDHQSNDEESNLIAERSSSQDVQNLEEELHKDQGFGNGTLYYKLEIITMQLISAHGNQVWWGVSDYAVVIISFNV